MTEYLDKGDVLEVINYIRTKYISVYNRKDKCSQFWADTMRYFEKQINNLAACDVVDAVYGKWVIDSDGCHPYCSECKNEPYGRKMSKYCPHCGAEMEGWQQWLNT